MGHSQMLGGAQTLLALLKASLKFSSCSTNTHVSSETYVVIKQWFSLHVVLRSACTAIQHSYDCRTRLSTNHGAVENCKLCRGEAGLKLLDYCGYTVVVMTHGCVSLRLNTHVIQHGCQMQVYWFSCDG